MRTFGLDKCKPVSTPMESGRKLQSSQDNEEIFDINIYHIPREYKRRHDTVAKLVQWKLCEKHNLERTERWYEHCPKGVVENDDVKLFWDINIQCDNIIEARRPNLILVDKKRKSSSILLYQGIVEYVRKNSKD